MFGSKDIGIRSAITTDGTTDIGRVLLMRARIGSVPVMMASIFSMDTGKAVAVGLITTTVGTGSGASATMAGIATVMTVIEIATGIVTVIVTATVADSVPDATAP
jgi:uncharacterized protein (DUF697 family)